MANQKLLCVFLVIFMMMQSSFNGSTTATSVESKSTRSPCENYSPEQAVVGLWSLGGPLSPLVTELKNTIVSLLPRSNKRQLCLLIGASLWTVDRLTGINAPLVLVFDALINQTISRRNSCDKEPLYQAVNDYGNLCQSAIGNSVQIGLRAAGCPTTIELKQQNIQSPNCDTNCIQLFFDTIATPMPEKLKDIVLRLSLSPNLVDQAVATGCIAAATPSSLDLFETLMECDELLKVLRLKSCNFKIPEGSCQARKKELQHECDKLKKIATATFKLMTNK